MLSNLQRKKAVWETDSTYCDNVKRTPPYGGNNFNIVNDPEAPGSERLLHLMDMAVLDFLIGKMR